MTEDNNNNDTPTDGLLAGAARKLGEVADKVVDAVEDGVEAIGDAVEDAVEGAAEVVASTVEDVGGAVEGAAADALGDKPKKLANALPGAEDEHSVAGAAAHLFGISRPQDEYGTRASDRDAMTDDELLEMGIEPDAGPSFTLMATFVGLVGVLLIVGGALGSMFKVVTLAEHEAKANVVHPLLASSHAASSEALSGYAPVEHPATDSEPQGPTGYRVPVDVGMNMLLGSPELLRQHPMGESSQPAAPVVPTPVPAAVPAAVPAVPTGAGELPAVQEFVPAAAPAAGAGH